MYTINHIDTKESSLLIAIKEKYYGIVELLTNFNRSILNTLSKNGMTCLEVTFKLKDYNAMLLLLNLGADPNMCNKDGCPVLLSILKNDTSHEVMPFILLLLRYKANPSKCDDEGNNAFHILALDKKTNLYLAFELFRASPGGAQMRNGFQDQIPYDLCSINGNVKMGRFFFDALFFSRTPFLFPSILMGSFLCITFEALHRWGYLYACLFAFFMSMLLKPLMQSSIICYRDRSDMGVSLGFTIAWIVSFIRDLSPHISSTLYDLISIFAIITMLFTCIFLRKSPEHGKSEVDQKEIIRRIVSLSPIEGPRAEQIQSIPQKPLFACTTCLTNALDSYQYVSHCKSCRECIINKDVHVTFLGNCSGQGNKRVFVLFTISSIVTFALYLQASFVTYRSFCPDAKGMVCNCIINMLIVFV